MQAPAGRTRIRRGLIAGSAWLLGLLSGMAAGAAQQRASDVAYVETTSGRAAAVLGESRTAVEPLDPIYDGMRLELAPDAETRICHYRSGRQIILKGPLQAIVSTAGVTADGRAVGAAGESCAAPAISGLPGGLPLRAGPPKIGVALQPRIRIVNRTAQAALSAILWDRAHRTALVRFDGGVVQPQLSEGKTYFLAVTIPGAGERGTLLEANAVRGNGTLIVVVRNAD